MPRILNPTPGDGTVEIDPNGERTIQATITDPDTSISQMIVQWSVDDEDITYRSQQIPGGDPDEDEFITAVLSLVYDELLDHDQDTIELYVSDRDNEVTATWVLTVLVKP